MVSVVRHPSNGSFKWRAVLLRRGGEGFSVSPLATIAMDIRFLVANETREYGNWKSILYPIYNETQAQLHLLVGYRGVPHTSLPHESIFLPVVGM